MDNKPLVIGETYFTPKGTALIYLGVGELGYNMWEPKKEEADSPHESDNFALDTLETNQ
jgi:hypothetical protein